jgi:hypothetical protein
MPLWPQDGALAAVIELLGGTNQGGRVPAKGSGAVVVVQGSGGEEGTGRLAHLQWTTPELLVVRSRGLLKKGFEPTCASLQVLRRPGTCLLPGVRRSRPYHVNCRMRLLNERQ